MKSIKGFEQRLDNLSFGPRERSDEERAWFYRFTPSEIGLIGNILINHKLAGDHLLEKLTQEEIDILNALLSRPILPMPPINKNEPRCNVCGEQPAYERDGSLPICDACYAYMIGERLP